MTETASVAPEPEAVGELYDRLLEAELEGGAFDPNLHIGYWEDPESDLPRAEAVVRFTDQHVDRLGVGPGARVLDLGCGVGGPALRAVERTGAHLTGVSISAGQVAHANRLVADAGLAGLAEFRHGNAMALPFDDESFDAVMAIESLIHMPDREQVLSEVRRVLKPGGRLVLTELSERAPRPAVRHPAVEEFCRVSMLTLADPDAYVPMLHRAGLRLRLFLDITDHTVQRNFRDLAKQIGDVDGLLFHPRDLVGVHEVGCFLAVADRP
ncbi:methyltransferase domain-containing protein [Amycolatopsis sp. NPDC051061]|uniref:SAM-dependent methyltransferase n=1 Tax=Amycolatopsis sp. NPDC051061 TaxID=3155042 RepID=UPI00342644D7